MEYRICTRCEGLGGVTASACGRCGGVLRLADETEYVGHQFGSYLLTAVIGIGGMGVVYRARHVRLDKPAAVKLVPPQGSAGEFD